MCKIKVINYQGEKYNKKINLIGVMGLKIVCISAANVLKSRGNSASTKACEIIKTNLEKKYGEGVEVEIIPLVDFNLKPCIMCGECEKNQSCVYDKDFNSIFSRLAQADGVVVVCPHYAPIPSKLMIILEKLQEFTFLSYCSKTFDSFPLKGKRTAIIGHGGMNEGFEKIYRVNLLDNLSGALGGCGMRVVGLDDEWKNGVVFGIEDMKFREGETLPYMVHNWDKVEDRIMPLIYKIADEIS